MSDHLDPRLVDFVEVGEAARHELAVMEELGDGLLRAGLERQLIRAEGLMAGLLELVDQSVFEQPAEALKWDVLGVIVGRRVRRQRDPSMRDVWIEADDVERRIDYEEAHADDPGVWFRADAVDFEAALLVGLQLATEHEASFPMECAALFAAGAWLGYVLEPTEVHA